MPEVSIIIPTYNRAQYLEKTLESIMAQTYQNFEVIVIDDGTPSNDNETICAKFKKVKYFKIENSGGPARPRNVGIGISKGKYVAFLDDDDLWEPNKLFIQVAILEKNKEFGLVHSCCNVIDEDGIDKGYIIGRPVSLNEKHGEVSMRMMGSWTLMMPTPLVRRDIINEVGFFNEKMPPAGEDAEYWIRCSFVTKFYYLDTPLAYYRNHINNISDDKRKYIDLSLYLKRVLENQLELQHITKKQYSLLLNKLCKMQINSLRSYFFRSTRNLFLLDLFWIFKTNRFKKYFGLDKSIIFKS